MSLISLIIIIVVIGIILWLVNTFIPMDGTVKKILNVVVIIALILWLLYAFMGGSHVADIKVPTIR